MSKTSRDCSAMDFASRGRRLIILLAGSTVSYAAPASGRCGYPCGSSTGAMMCEGCVSEHGMVRISLGGTVFGLSQGWRMISMADYTNSWKSGKGSTSYIPPITTSGTLASSPRIWKYIATILQYKKHLIHNTLTHLQSTHSYTNPSNHPPPSFLQDRPQQSHPNPHPTPQQGRLPNSTTPSRLTA